MALPSPRVVVAMLATIVLTSPSIAVAGDMGAIECRFDSLRLCTLVSDPKEFIGGGGFEKGDPGCGSAKPVTLTYYPLARSSGMATVAKAGDYSGGLVKAASQTDRRFTVGSNHYAMPKHPEQDGGRVELLVVRQTTSQTLGQTEVWTGVCLDVSVDEDAFQKALQASGG